MTQVTVSSRPDCDIESVESAYVVQSDFFVMPEHMQEFRAVLAQHARNSVCKERGCLSYEATVEEQNPQIFNVYEKYVDKNSYIEHRSTPHYSWFREQVQSMLYKRDDDVVISRRKFSLVAAYFRRAKAIP